tara:strand:- start:1307 stop:1666 length:360 start_codon:yes stop_codon:yes gene_type:complete
MKKLLLLPLVMGMVLTSCGDASENASEDASSEQAVASGDKSFCDCMEIASNDPEMEEAPAGCEWIDELTDEEGEKALRAALDDCPDNLPEGMVDMLNAADELEDMVDDLDAELEDMDEE